MIALVLWRLRDPAWKPSFADLLEDARTCSDPATEPATVLAALREALVSDEGLAARARLVAVQAQHFMASRAGAGPVIGPPVQSPPRAPERRAGQIRSMRRFLADLRPAFLGG